MSAGSAQGGYIKVRSGQQPSHLSHMFPDKMFSLLGIVSCALLGVHAQGRSTWAPRDANTQAPSACSSQDATAEALVYGSPLKQ